MKRALLAVRRIAPAWMILALAACGGSGEMEGRGDEADDTKLWGTSWRLEDLGGTGVIDIARATLEFPEPGRMAGNGSCNRFFGAVELRADSIAFGPLATTRMACDDAVNDQETKYIKALSSAQRYEIQDSFLLIYSAELEQPLKFVRADEPEEAQETEE